MPQPSMFPFVSFDLIDDGLANQMLIQWRHFKGACNRPFGRHSFGLFFEQELLAVAVSASTVNKRCAEYERKEVVELARLCSHPEHADLTRVTLRLWRKIAPVLWEREYWPIRACVSYADLTRHQGDIYRFDGWKKIKEVPGGKAGGKRGGNKLYNPKSIWVYEVKLQEKLN